MDPFHMDSPHMDSPDMDSPNMDPPPPSESLPAKRQRKLKFETFDFTGADDFQVQSDDDELYVEEADKGADIESVLGSTKEDHMEEVEGDEDDNDPDINADDEEPVQRHRLVWRSANPKPQSVSFQPLVQKANSKAGQLYNKPTARFRCPLVNCKIIMPETTTLEQLWEHASDKQHLLGLYNQDRYRCELGCKESFTDTLGRVYHYAMQKCRIDMLEDYQCTTKGCAGPFDNDPTTRLIHYFKNHAPAAYHTKGIKFIDEACELGFESRSLLHYHLWGGTGLKEFSTRGSTHLKQVVEMFRAKDIVILQ
ncbi:hypothetical protein KCU89_g5632, partial [Aureobasidium melanogenum]